jgi:signal transduction histidine kinase
MENFKKMMIESKMYTTNWVFFRSREEDKAILTEIHDTRYAALKKEMNERTVLWNNKTMSGDMDSIFSGFEQLLAIERTIMNSLKRFEDYDDPVIKLNAELQVEEEILPRTTALVGSLDRLIDMKKTIREKEVSAQEAASIRLSFFIIILAITIVAIGLFLSIYMSSLIIRPIRKICYLINDLGKGKIRQVNYRENGNEIGTMIQAVNNLSEKLQATASFAHETGLRNFDIPFQPLSDEDTLGKALISMRENLKTGETNLELQNRELERKNKELEQFAYVASHDLQEPLRTISSFVEVFQKQYKGKIDDKADKYIEYIVQASTRMRVLITDLLEYSRIGSRQEFKRVDCNIVLNEALNDLGAAIEETGADIKVGPLPVINGFQTEMKLLFQNLAVNAIKFRRKDVQPQIKISAKRKRDSWQFSFTDNGIGIAKEHNERIFIIFQRLHTRNEYQGSGIGLSHCKKIVELHKGKIWLESEVGKGTTFYFTIPQN